MRFVPRIEYLRVPAVITGKHAELLATDGRRLCQTGIHIDRIGKLEPHATHTALWHAWCRGLSYWRGRAWNTQQIKNDAWKRKVANWTSGACRRVTEQPPYKGIRPRIHTCHYSNWEEAISRVLHQIRSKWFYQKLSGWGRWATFAVNNARKRKGAR